MSSPTGAARASAGPRASRPRAQDRIPLTRDTPFFNEVVFHHIPSKTLIVTDLWWNYPNEAPTLWKFGMDRVYAPVYNRLMRTSTWDDSFNAILRWDFEYMAPCHGEPVADGAKGALRRHLGYDRL